MGEIGIFYPDQCCSGYCVGDDLVHDLRQDQAERLVEVLQQVQAAAWDEGERHESDHLITYGQFCPRQNCNPYRNG